MDDLNTSYIFIHHIYSYNTYVAYSKNVDIFKKIVYRHKNQTVLSWQVIGVRTHHLLISLYKDNCAYRTVARIKYNYIHVKLL